ncbi:hypothetical protein NPIL_482371 [Nephila pilipes]|uniref:Uncharacterized protein n=1 Tax=Nephila pilipes TaxID=299642 RepID=A0A8X6IAV4_NEPPI|nr:hypothetical protein NPIL_482371 [Nephila pilipes]
MVAFFIQQYCSCIWQGITLILARFCEHHYCQNSQQMYEQDGKSCSYICTRRKLGQRIWVRNLITPLTKPIFTAIFDLNITLATTNISNSVGRPPVLLMSVGIILLISNASMLRLRVASTN